MRGALLKRTVARRAFGVLGSTAAAGSMLAFVVSVVAAGWAPGEPFPGGDVVAAASGGAFMAVIFSQIANAFVCRSMSLPPWRLGWTGNRLLLVAVAASVVLALVLLWVPSVARALGHANPPPAGWLVAVAAAGLTLGIDALDKQVRRHRRARRTAEVGGPTR